MFKKATERLYALQKNRREESRWFYQKRVAEFAVAGLYAKSDSEKRKALYQLKDIAAFETFYEKRRKLMIDKLCDLLK